MTRATDLLHDQECSAEQKQENIIHSTEHALRHQVRPPGPKRLKREPSKLVPQFSRVGKEVTVRRARDITSILTCTPITGAIASTERRYECNHGTDAGSHSANEQ